MLVFAPIFLASWWDKKNADSSVCCPQSQPCGSLSDEKSSWILEANRGKRWVDSNSNEVTCQQSGTRRQGQKVPVERCSERSAQQPRTSISLHEAEVFIRMQSSTKGQRGQQKKSTSRKGTQTMHSYPSTWHKPRVTWKEKNSVSKNIKWLEFHDPGCLLQIYLFTLVFCCW